MFTQSFEELSIKTNGIKKTKFDVKKVLPESVINKYGNLNVWIK